MRPPALQCTPRLLQAQVQGSSVARGQPQARARESCELCGNTTKSLLSPGPDLSVTCLTFLNSWAVKLAAAASLLTNGPHRAGLLFLRQDIPGSALAEKSPSAFTAPLCSFHCFPLAVHSLSFEPRLTNPCKVPKAQHPFSAAPTQMLSPSGGYLVGLVPWQTSLL